eukprot:14622398-Ditylum_brightwellii.AAC.1
MEERKHMGTVQRQVTPNRSASTSSSFQEQGRGQVENAHSARSLRTTRHSATGNQFTDAGETNKHTDTEMEPVEETGSDLL